MAVRVIIRDVIKRLDIYPKMDTYYDHYVKDKDGLFDYGFILSKEDYLLFDREWNNKYSKENNIDGYCRFLLEYYRTNFDRIGRDKDFEY